MKISMIDRHVAAEMFPGFPLPGRCFLSNVTKRRDLVNVTEGFNADVAGTDRFAKFSNTMGLTRWRLVEGGIRMSWMGKLRAAEAEMLAQSVDPWRLPLQRLRGKIGGDGVERIGTQAVLDFLDVAQRDRGAGACRRLRKLMCELGWHPIKARGLNQRGLLEQIRGFARDPRHSPLS